jgi:hypothetical protein
MVIGPMPSPATLRAEGVLRSTGRYWPLAFPEATVVGTLHIPVGGTASADAHDNRLAAFVWRPAVRPPPASGPTRFCAALAILTDGVIACAVAK